ncbi:MAG: CAP domain-containing protein [Niastella sp.]|uniref:CAP domain-containing protein n=1 Tax=Niastella sp. TaxID=1869183 RepID=UPI00389A3A75
MKYVFFLSLVFSSSVIVEANPAIRVPEKRVSAVVTLSTDYSGMANDVLKNVNEHRRKKGLSPLVMNNVMSAEALKHSQNMASRRTSFGHNGFDGRSNRISSAISGISEIGENVSMGSTSAKEVVDNWLRSAVHRENIEGRYKITGIGIAADKRGILYFTQIFAMN